MKAAVLYAVDDLRVAEVPEPTTEQGMTIVRVKACGICSSDVARIKRDGTYNFPTIPGHEYSGFDEKGKLVAVYPLIPCRTCQQCHAGRYQCCLNYNYTGSRCDGGFAEKVKVPMENLIPVPEGVSPAEAAMTEPAGVAMHAMRKAGICKSDTVVIVGCGTIGLIAAQIARAMAAKEVICVDIDNGRLELAKSLGFSHIANSKDDLAQSLGGVGDVVVEMVGLSATYNLAVDLAKAGGRLIFTGNITDDLVIPRKRFSTILRKELMICGTWNSVALGTESTDWHEVMRFQAERRIDLSALISHNIGLDQLPEMIDQMAGGQEVFGKVIVNISD